MLKTLCVGKSLINYYKILCKTYTMKYKSCAHVPCGYSHPVHNRCKPSYCYSEKHKGSSKHWSSCNMKNWFAKGTPRHTYQSSFCKKPKGVVKVNNKTRIDKYQVDALVLHNKMPYIWRFMTPRTQKKMILLAKLPKRIINAFPNAKDEKNKKRTKLVRSHLRMNGL